MKFMPRAATFAAVTFCAGALANAATLDAVPASQEAPVQVINTQEHHVVPAPRIAAQPVLKQDGEIVQPLPEAALKEDQDFATLSAAVAAHEDDATADAELNCLAIGVYYESKSEPLAGQLAVADVLINRTKSGRFPKSVCSVLTQRGQFSFVRGGKLPTPPANAQWRKALAVAKVARNDQWDSPAGEALYFHARYVRPGWNRPRVATVGNHIFYR
ncbi:spore germination cell wall hydrolase CwlJ-like protein [Sphingomonas naasensis]|uniref:Cell wall hydrolase n=1 Tax=Sphingomonas naasensis TaxID=1344951 RepID=A0A4S1W8G1_9SPHN|nr:cell wall hydrolase [Sphingomonas naasensis]NIJ21277.1 spore germination cell wall hydrolase CwlJ-like protein [Sphingomonas naasensis]TGX38713.1 cell wall hydrolase [Sphingomonas naasensis]